MMPGMRPIDIHNDLADEIEPGPIAVGPDGSLGITQNARATPPPPRICEAGPCRHYHRFVTQLDAERPMAGGIEHGGEQHGRLIGDAGPAPFYVRVHHFCYPTAGIECDLRDLPVLECNRWSPQVGYSVDEQDRQKFIATEAGQRHQREMAAWIEARRAEALESATDSAITPEITHVIVWVGGHNYKIKADGWSSILAVCQQACVAACMSEPSAEWILYDHDGNPITNLDATLHQLGIADGQELTITYPAGHGA